MKLGIKEEEQKKEQEEQRKIKESISSSVSVSVSVSLVIPAYNEEKAIIPVVEEALPYVDEIVIVDDGSTDRTFSIALNYLNEYKKTICNDNISGNNKHNKPKPQIKIIKHKKNCGKVKALCSGIEHSSGNIIIFTDADYTYPASAFPEMISAINQGADLVLGSRLKGNIKNMHWFNKTGNKVFSFITTYISCTTITDPTTGLRAFKRDSFEKLHIKAKSLEYEIKMSVRAAKLGYNIKEIPITLRKRIGKSKLRPFRDGLRMFGALAHIGYSETSLLAKTIMFPSLIFIIIGLFLGIQSIIEYLSQGAPLHPYYPLLTVLGLVMGVQLFSLGLIIDNLTKKLSRIEEKIKG